MSQAAKFGDVVIGVDIHMVMIPSPAGPIPTPLPHPFVGVVFDPVGAACGAAMSGGAVLINGLPVGNTGMEARGIKHIPMPPGVAFAPSDIPDSKGTVVTGSKTVSMAGAAAGRLMSMVSSCGFPLNLPTSLCMAVPMGAPVIVGGPDTMDVMAAVTRGIRTKWFSDAAMKFLKAGPRLSKLICFLTGHPVDVMTGEVLTDCVDFELPGPIPLVFERNYYSHNKADGPLGPGWHHPLNASVQEVMRAPTGTVLDPRKALKVRLPDGRERDHEVLPVGGSRWDDIDRYMLEHTTAGYVLTFWDGRSYHFAPVPNTPVSHALVRITDRCANAIELSYHEGRPAYVTDTMGRVLAFIHAKRRLAAIKLRGEGGAWSELVRYEYDRDGRLAAAIDPLENAMRYAYRGGVLVKETNRNGLSFYFEYDWYNPEGWCSRTWGDGGIYDRRITYDEHRHVTIVDDSRNGRTHYYGNAGGLVDREVDPTGREKRYEWDQSYRKTAEIDGLGNRTEWAYDAHGNPVLHRDALGHETRAKYNELNLLVERVDAAGGVSTREYDRTGKLVSAKDALGNVVNLKHDGRGNLVELSDASGRTIKRRYDDAGGLVEKIDGEGRVTRYAYDERGSMIGVVDPRGAQAAILRDACGRPTVVRRPDESTIRLGYDGESNVVEHTDPLGNVSRLRYAGMNKLAERVDPAGGVLRFAYDKEEELVAVTNEADEEYRFERDLAGRIVKEHGFDARTLEFWFDRAGRCREMVNAQRKRTQIERDALGQIVKMVVPRNGTAADPIPDGEEVAYAWDALGQMVRAQNSACEVVFARDAVGRVVEERANGQVIESAYDPAGNRVRRSTGLGHTTEYGFDGNGDLLSVMFGRDSRWMDFSPESLSRPGSVHAPWQATIKRDVAGSEAERQFPAGVVSAWKRDAWGRAQVHRVARGGDVVMGTGYQWRSSEQIAGLIDTFAGPTWFQHDARSYLSAATRPDGIVEVRAPDAVGNLYRTADRRDRVYGLGGVIQEAGSVQYVHDADGQLVEKINADGTSWKYTWDHAGQLERVRRPDGQVVAFKYDALRRRIEKTFGGRTTRYVWDRNEIVHELTEGAPVTTWVFEPGSFAPIAKVEGEKRYAVVADQLGTPTALFDDAGKMAWRARLDTYGAAQIEVATTACPWRWPGQYEDGETGLYYNRFRYYDPDTGRYISADPSGLVGGLNLYAYVPDPFAWMDPFGLNCGKKGEEIAAKWLEEKGFKVLGPIQNTSGHGIDLVARDAAGELWFYEVKTTEGLVAPALRGEQNQGAQFVESRLKNALGWKSVDDPNTRALARDLLDELKMSGGDPRGQLIKVTLGNGEVTPGPWKGINGS